MRTKSQTSPLGPEPAEGPDAALGDDDRLAAWAHAYVVTDRLEDKLSPPSPAVDDAESAPFFARAAGRADVPNGPGRPPELRVSWAKYKAPRSAHALMNVEKRAHLLHTFFHHELQAAELMCWAFLRFADAPRAFRRGLLHIARDEIRHMNAYAQRLRELGYAIGAFEVRDWFWERAPSAASPSAFVALMGLGFEAGNLDHSQRYARMFAEAGDTKSAALQSAVGDDEVQHVAFGARWFHAFEGRLDFDTWRARLPAPLSPMVMRGQPLDAARRRAAGFDDAFLEALTVWEPASRGA